MRLGKILFLILCLFPIAYVYAFTDNSVEQLGPTEGLEDYYSYPVEMISSPVNGVEYVLRKGILYKTFNNVKNFLRLVNQSKYFFDNNFIVFKQDDSTILVNVPYISYDGGITWYRLNDLYNQGIYITSLSIHKKRWLIGTENGQIYLSDNGGKEFQLVFSKQDITRSVLAISNFYGSTVFAYVKNSGLYRSDDGGFNWKKIGNSSNILYFYKVSKIIFYAPKDSLAIMGNGKCFISTDGGRTFQEITLAEDINDISFDKDGNIFIATDDGLYRSSDNGTTWTFVKDGYTYSVYHDPDNNLLVAGRKGFVNISYDNGKSWKKYGLGVKIKFLAKDKKGNLYVVLWNKSDVYKYSQKEKIWKHLKNIWQIKHFAVIEDSIFYDLGYHFKKCDLSLNNCHEIWKYRLYDCYFPDIDNAQKIWISGWTGDKDGIFVSSDGGSSWNYIGSPSKGSVSKLAYDEINNIIYAYSSTLYTSPDKGKTWVNVGINGVKDMSIINGKAFICTDHGLYISSDGNSFIKPQLKGVYSVSKVASDPENNDFLLAITDNGIYKSTDGGLSWTRFQHFINENYEFFDILKAKDRWLAATDDGIISFKDNNPPTAPVILFPEDNATVTSRTTLRWKPSVDKENDVVRYTVFLGKKNEQEFYPVVGCISITDTVCTLNNLKIKQDYIWYVEASDGMGGINKSEKSSFYCAPDGDLTRDNVINTADAIMALRFAAGISIPTREDLLHGDVAPVKDGKPVGDGDITVKDAIEILRKVVSLEE